MSTESVQVNQIDAEVMERAGKIGQRVSIEDARLVGMTVKLGEVSGKDPSLVRLSHGHGFRRLPAESKVQVLLGFRFELAHDDEVAKKEPVASIEATYCFTYAIPDLSAVDDSDLAAFAQVNGHFNAWPFWRELVHSTLGRMGLRSVALPSLRTSAKPPDVVSSTEARP